MLKEPHVQVLAEKLRVCLDQATGKYVGEEIENIYLPCSIWLLQCEYVTKGLNKA